ncbi:FG-GAP-like repeat-containing protein [Fulvivirgaceae bacterium BMA10]|uniref:FG-GAP-like repeat-containing protein n=1 Tax=Splendidivirga corallicola TaxID=3051826 RepID=A0ABT8KXV1_9BACT|nr:FG-GAP-like repeat-containing protein [Fulvivirgaceae bacterium BMA10]
MKTLAFKIYAISFLLVCNLATKSFAQFFEHVERNVGLSVLEENNGVAVADYDKDNDLDLFVVAKSKDRNGVESSHSRLFNNQNGYFIDVTEESGLMDIFPSEQDSKSFIGLDGTKYGVSWGDYDNDGFPDLFFTHAFKIQLFHNEGDGTFMERTIEAGLAGENDCGNTSAIWLDINNDGFLDIYICNWKTCPDNIFYLNNGDGTFEDVTIQFGNEEHDQNKTSYHSIPFDFNQDGWMDLYVANDDNPNELLINKGGMSFEDQAQYYNADIHESDMGLAIGDYNNDGYFDIYITNIDRNILLKNQGDNTFKEVGIRQNVTDAGWAWGTCFADFDNDGDEDLYVTNGFWVWADYTESSDYNVYFKNLLVEGQGGFIRSNEAVNINDLAISVGATPFDYDNDGDLDLYVTNTDRPSYFYENKLIHGSEPEGLNWFKVSLEGSISNRDAIGTTVSIITDTGEFHRYHTGIHFLSQSLQPVHFGIGSASEIREVKIKWPSGLTDTYTNLAINTMILATEANGYEVVDIKPASKQKGCIDATACNYNPAAGVDNGSCIYNLPAKPITGNKKSGFLRVEEYSYPLATGATIQWEVSGGEIISGQGTDRISVKWGIAGSGEISLIESNAGCSSEPVAEAIELNVSHVSKNQSLARLWNEALLNAIRGDYARPTIHARNLFHTAVAMYDAWAVFDNNAKTYLIGNKLHHYTNEFDGFRSLESIGEARNKTLSYAAYRLLCYRFQDSPDSANTKQTFDVLMNKLGYDINFISTDYSEGDAAALGNFIAKSVIDYGHGDGSRENTKYDNAYYKPVNPPLNPTIAGNNNLKDPNRWQPLTLNTFIDQSGNLVDGSTPDFLSPEWGSIAPFSLSENEKSQFQRIRDDYTVYHDPMSPPYLDLLNDTDGSQAYKWGFSLVSIWGSHLDHNDGVLWDISPGAIGNIDSDLFPKNYEAYSDFYNAIDGGDIGKGHSKNPVTNAPYAKQMVPRGDYARVLAEFWADGPDSETPPGHWFTLLNYVSDHPLLEKKMSGKSITLDPLEWDVKAYFILGGAMHDAAIAAWGIKGWYDYIRPISAIRYMAGLGQSTDVSKENYHIAGIPLKKDLIEMVESLDDPLAGQNGEHLGKIKLYTWRGHDYINDQTTDQAGVGWILAENWWPYQRPTFVTPPFAGFVSGHSTFSRAAAEVLTLLTGNAYFPGGYGEFIARKNEFLVFEEGPSMDVKLQWATYRDASDQCSLSRIWGGIHPPADDIPGRLIGEQIGRDAFEFATKYFKGKLLRQVVNQSEYLVYPNPITDHHLRVKNTENSDEFSLFNIEGRSFPLMVIDYDPNRRVSTIRYPETLQAGIYILRINRDARILIKLNN